MIISNPDKVLFPADGITKGELASYYTLVSNVMLPHVAERPLTMERYPAGIQAKGFMQKDVSKGFPEWLKRVEVSKKGGSTHYPLVTDLESLLWIANQNCITPHVWTSRYPELHKPDLCVIDLDPSQDDSAVLRQAALWVRDLLSELGLRSWVKTSGSKGYHIVIPLDGKSDTEDVWAFGHGLGALLVKRHPDHLTQEFIKSDRAGRILVDTGRNGYGATFAAAYAVRSKPHAPVSAPCAWNEIENGQALPQSFALRTMPARLDAVGDLWAEVAAHVESLVTPLARVRELLSAEDWQTSLAASTRKPKARVRK